MICITDISSGNVIQFHSVSWVELIVINHSEGLSFDVIANFFKDPGYFLGQEYLLMRTKNISKPLEGFFFGINIVLILFPEGEERTSRAHVVDNKT